MQTERSEIAAKIAIPSLALLMLAVWLVVGMVYLDRFPLSLKWVELVFMPWKRPMPAEANLVQRLDLMQEQLDASARVSSYALTGLIVSFAALSVYLSILFQQKQRRVRENMILLLKNSEIARRSEFIRYISATIGHEFKNNLGRIKRRIDLLSELSPDARGRIDDNLEKLFADIDIFKKISDEREAALVEFKNIDLKEMLDDLANQYRDIAEIGIREVAPLSPIYAAPVLVKTVFENVFDNAVKYRKPGEPTARILVSCSMDQDGSRRYVSISVRDEGIGMDERQADECFYKGKGVGESWGQGLYFTKYVVGLHAGKIRVGKEYTAPGRGTEIIINLPFVEEQLDV